MFTYQTHHLPLVGASDLPFVDRVKASLVACPQVACALLDGWIQGRTSEVDLSTLRVTLLEGDDSSGALEIAFDETSWAACRLETLRAPHRGRIPYRRDAQTLLLDSLPRDAFAERDDDL
jgi:hypothetical protein